MRKALPAGHRFQILTKGNQPPQMRLETDRLFAPSADLSGVTRSYTREAFVALPDSVPEGFARPLTSVELDRVREQPEALRNTRCHRLASNIAAPLDRLRDALSRRR
jgi:hypothetical protein